MDLQWEGAAAVAHGTKEGRKVLKGGEMRECGAHQGFRDCLQGR